MNTHRVFSSKAEKYARYRWGYVPEAVEVFCRSAGLSAQSLIADLGAGTGILTRPLAERVGRIVAIEPNLEMRREAHRYLAGLPSCQMLAAGAEAMPLADGSLDAIVAAEAVHWFDFIPARDEILRVLKPGGWLGLFHNAGKDEELGQALNGLRAAELGVVPPAFRQPGTPWEAFFNGGKWQKEVFPFSFSQNWEQFFGALISTSYMPDEDHPLYPRLEQAARQVFERFSQDGWMEVHAETELMVGRPERLI